VILVFQKVKRLSAQLTSVMSCAGCCMAGPLAVCAPAPQLSLKNSACPAARQLLHTPIAQNMSCMCKSNVRIGQHRRSGLFLVLLRLLKNRRLSCIGQALLQHREPACWSRSVNTYVK
jgi:hypothetical protein